MGFNVRIFGDFGRACKAKTTMPRLLHLQFMNQKSWDVVRIFTDAHRLKITHTVAFEFLKFGIFHQFLSYQKTDLSGNTVRPQALGFEKLAKMAHFLAFLNNFCPLKM